MMRMALETRVIYRSHLRMLLEIACNPQRAFVLMAHAHRQCLHPAMQQKTCVRVERPAEMTEPDIDRIDQLSAPNNGTGHDVRMAIEILGTGMQRKVEAVLCRPEINRAGECVVDHRRQVILAG